MRKVSDASTSSRGSRHSKRGSETGEKKKKKYSYCHKCKEKIKTSQFIRVGMSVLSLSLSPSDIPPSLSLTFPPSIYDHCINELNFCAYYLVHLHAHTVTV